MKIYSTLLTIILFTSLVSSAQNHDHDEGHQHHEIHKNEIGMANSLVYQLKSEVFSYGIHLHYVRAIKQTRFGAGLAYERIFDEHGHNTFGVVGSYRPKEMWIIAVSPGITFEDHHREEVGLALHIETNYEFEINSLHIGPLIEFAIDPEDYHISLGLHIGFGW